MVGERVRADLTGLFTTSISSHFHGASRYCGTWRKRSDAQGATFMASNGCNLVSYPAQAASGDHSITIASTTSHMATQASRVVYPSYELAGAMPGVLVCNLTFGLAMLLGIFAGVVQGIREAYVRHKRRYPPTLVAIFSLRRKGGFSWLQLICCRLDLLRKSHTEERTRGSLRRAFQASTHAGASSFRIRSSETHGKGCSKTADAHHRDGTSVSSAFFTHPQHTWPAGVYLEAHHGEVRRSKLR